MNLRTLFSMPPIGAVVVAVILAAGFAGGVAAERAGLLPPASSEQPPGLETTFAVFWQAWNLAQQDYVDRTALDAQQMTYGAARGMLDALGDVGHTRFLSPKEWQAEQQALAGKLEGIGAELTTREGRATILASIPGSPAQKAGLRSGDILVRVDGQDVAALPLDQVAVLIRGPAGTTVTLTVLRPSLGQLLDFSITRAKITVPSVSWTMVPGTSTAHILISRFAERAIDELVSAIDAAKRAGAATFVLDLRNNPGGLRDEAVVVASQFLREGNVLIEQDAQGRRTEFPVRPGGAAVDVPLVALINEGTASAAEITAGALRDHQRARLIGTATVGTGTVLSTYQLSDGSAIFLGTREWLTPNGHRIWHRGITPDITVTLPANAVPLLPSEEATMSAGQVQANGDVQLLGALQELAAPSPR